MNDKKRKFLKNGSLNLAPATSATMCCVVSPASPSVEKILATSLLGINTNDAPVKVKDLIDLHNYFPEDLPVFISGKKTGYDCFYLPDVCRLVHKLENMYLDGEYQFLKTGDSFDLSAVIMVRVHRDD